MVSFVESGSCEISAGFSGVAVKIRDCTGFLPLRVSFRGSAFGQGRTSSDVIEIRRTEDVFEILISSSVDLLVGACSGPRVRSFWLRSISDEI